MIRLAFSAIMRSWRVSFLFILTITVLLVAGTALLNSVYLIQVQVGENIEKHGRGAYDILVRPAGSLNQVEETFGLVEDNYLSSGEGGLSIAQWQEIKKLPLVEVAVPVAAVGYFTGITSSVTLEIPSVENGGVDIRFKTSDGLTEYVVGVPTKSFIIENPSDYGAFEIIGDYQPYAEVMLDSNNSMPITLIPQTYHSVVAIDETEEEALTGLSFAELNRSLTGLEEMQLDFAGDAPIIPVLTLQDPKVPLAIEWDFTTYDFSEGQIANWRKQLGVEPGQSFSEGDNYEAMLNIANELLAKHKKVEIYPYSANLSEMVIPFMAKPSEVAMDGSITEPNFHTISQANTTTYYDVGSLSYEINGNDISILKIGDDASGVPLFRNVEKKGGAFYELEELPFVMHPIGQFSTVDHSGQLSASPLGFYSQLPVVSENGEVLHETIIPGGYIQPPAHGIVRMSDIGQLKDGDPIDAIRIRVAGKGGYTDNLIKKVEETVVALSQLGDFQIDVVAGASPREIPVEVEGIGIVAQPWTTLGTTAVIAGGWNLVQLMTSILFIFVGFIFLRSRIAFWQLEKASEEALLINIGWRSREVKRYATAERNLLLGLSFILGAIVLFSVISFGWIDRSGWKVFLLIVFMIFILSSLFARLKRRFERNETVIKTTSLPLKNILSYHNHIFYSALQLLLVSILAVFIVGSTSANQEQTSVTLLGAFIDDALGSLLFMILIASIGFAIMTTIDGQEAMRQARLKEVSMLRAIGWRNSTIRAFWLKETLIWSVPTLVLGTGIGFLIVAVVFDWSTLLFIQMIGIFVLLFVVTLVTVLLGFRRISS